MNEMLYPHIVRIVVGRRSVVLPTHILFQPRTAPIGHIEWWVGQDEIRLEIVV